MKFRELREFILSFKWAAIGILSNFTGKNPKPLQPNENSELVVRFARLISDRKYAEAYELTNDAFKQEMSLKDLEAKRNDLLPRQFGRARKIDIWLEREADGGGGFISSDITWVYVAIEGNYGQALAATVTAEGSRKLIRKVDWGRP